MLDPTEGNWGHGSSGSIKYIPVLLSTGSIALSFISNPLRIQKLLHPPALAIFALFVFMLCGSLTAYDGGNSTLMFTFLGRALNIIPFFSAALLADVNPFSSTPKTFSILILATGIIMLLLQGAHEMHLVYNSLGHIYHNQSPVALAATIGILNSRARTSIRTVSAISASAIFLITGKYTAVIWVLLIFMFYIYSLFIRTKSISILTLLKSRGFQVIGTIFVAALVISLGLVLFGAKKTQRYNDARWPAFEKRWEGFKDSPIVGTKFESSPILSVGDLVIPTHNDYLDILSGGGLVAFALLGLSVASAIRRAGRASFPNPERLGVTLALPALLIGCLINIMSNPMLYLPSTSFMIWVPLGLTIYWGVLTSTRPRQRRFTSHPQ